MFLPANTESRPPTARRHQNRPAPTLPSLVCVHPVEPLGLRDELHRSHRAIQTGIAVEHARQRPDPFQDLCMVWSQPALKDFRGLPVQPNTQPLIVRTAYLLNWTHAGQVDFTDGLPVGGVDYPRTYQEFRAWFPDDASCAEYLARLRWPEGFRCPVCGGDKAWQTSTPALEVCRLWAQDLGDSGDDLSPHAYAVEHVVCRDLVGDHAEERCVGAEPARHAGPGSYETAWAWLHKLRRAMVRPDRELLAGVVEVDEAFIGGRATGRQGASTEKVPVMIAVENLGTQVDRKLRLGRVRRRWPMRLARSSLSTSPGPPPHRAH